MPRKCIVPFCTSQKRLKTTPSFHIPLNPELRNKWVQVLQTERPLHPNDRVCREHFCEEDLQEDSTIKIGNTVHVFEQVRARLKSTAVPSIFPTRNTQPASKTVFSMPQATVRSDCDQNSCLKVVDYESTVRSDCDQNSCLKDDDYKATVRSDCDQNSCRKDDIYEATVPGDWDQNSCPKDDDYEATVQSDCAQKHPCINEDNSAMQTTHITYPLQTIDDLISQVSTVTIPSSSWGLHLTDNVLAFSRFSSELFHKGFFCEMGIVFQNSLIPQIIVRGRRVTGQQIQGLQKKVTCINDVAKILSLVDGAHTCKGYDTMPAGLYSPDCRGLVSAQKIRCRNCRLNGIKSDCREGKVDRKMRDLRHNLRVKLQALKRIKDKIDSIQGLKPRIRKAFVSAEFQPCELKAVMSCLTSSNKADMSENLSSLSSGEEN